MASTTLYNFFCIKNQERFDNYANVKTLLFLISSHVVTFSDCRWVTSSICSILSYPLLTKTVLLTLPTMMSYTQSTISFN